MHIFSVLPLLVVLATASDRLPYEFADWLEVDDDDIAPAAETAATAAETRYLFKKHHNSKQPLLYTQQTPPVVVAAAAPYYMPVATPSVPLRVETSNVIREFSCPFDMKLLNKQCVGRQITPLQYLCPPHTRLVDGRCFSYSRPVVECPHGYSLQNGRCKTCETFPAEFVCPSSDETLDSSGRACIRHIERPAECPHGYHMKNGDECVQSVPSVLQCPSDYQLSHASRKCVRSSTAAAQIICPDGADFDHDGQRCIVVKQDPPRCPKRFSFCASTQRCIQPVPEVPAECPPSYHKSGSVCETSESTAADAYCRDGFQHDGSNSCYREVSVAPHCPAGFQHSRDVSGMCEKMVKELVICPAGTTQVGSGSNIQCESIINHDLTQCCAPGFDAVDDHCERVETTPAKLSCTMDCYNVRTTPIAYACPPDSQFADDRVSPRCFRETVSVACRVPVFTPPARCMQDASGLRQSSDDSMVRSLAMDPECRPPPMPRDCAGERDYVPAQPYCPEGGEVEGNKCVLREPIAPTKSCPAGMLDPHTEQCVRVVKVPMKSECPVGTTRQGMTCISRERSHPDFMCPDGAEEGPSGSCIIRRDSIQNPPKFENHSVSYRCQSGRLGPDGRSCVTVHSMPIEMECPPESEHVASSTSSRNRCVITADLIVPAPVEKVVRPSYLCVDGSRPNGPTCTSVETIAALTICPSDASPRGYGDQCVRSTEPIMPPPRIVASVAVPRCPDGTMSRGMTCVASREEAPMQSCSEGYQLDGPQCVQQMQLQAVCPPGTSPTPEGCLREIVIAPTVRVVQGCVHSVVSTCPTCPRDVASQCHHL